MTKPLIFDIKRSSTVDGPGIRTAVFLKGCNLDCFWCHNPEGKRCENELAFFKEKCIDCKSCSSFCERSRDECTACGECTEVCPTGAIKHYGKKYTPEELFRILSRDREFYRATGGGVTFSGGECMLYPEYIAEVASLCKEAGISVAVDTAGCVPFSSFEKVMPYVDLFLYDLKCIDPDLHERGTGKRNGLILENLDALLLVGASVIVRIPSIPDFNEGDELEKIIALCEKKDLVYEVLSYHEYARSKADALRCSRN